MGIKKYIFVTSNNNILRIIFRTEVYRNLVTLYAVVNLLTRGNGLLPNYTSRIFNKYWAIFYKVFKILKWFYINEILKPITNTLICDDISFNMTVTSPNDCCWHKRPVYLCPMHRRWSENCETICSLSEIFCTFIWSFRNSVFKTMIN